MEAWPSCTTCMLVAVRGKRDPGSRQTSTTAPIRALVLGLLVQLLLHLLLHLVVQGMLLLLLLLLLRLRLLRRPVRHGALDAWGAIPRGSCTRDGFRVQGLGFRVQGWGLSVLASSGGRHWAAGAAARALD